MKPRTTRTPDGVATDAVAPDCEVLIAGAGVAGLGAGRLLAQAGLGVVCVEPDPFPRERVGESLDWSTPALLAQLGLSVDRLVEDGLGTWKRGLRGIVGGLPTMIGRPPPWVARWPLRFTAATVHVNRAAFDQALYQSARDAGVDFVWDRVESVVLAGDRVVECLTRSGLRYSCRWFLDASGRARILARSAAIGRRHYGVPRIALWSHVTAPMEADATTLHFADDQEQLGWIWEIPIEKGKRSFGVVMPLDRFRRLRRCGRKPQEIMRRELSRHPDLQDLLPICDLSRVESRTYQPYVVDRTVGANWLMVGEAAAFVDPLTSFGVTAALRNGIEAATLIGRSYTTAGTTAADLLAYDRRVRNVGDLYNRAINQLLYSASVRDALGLRWAARSYVVLGYVTNSMYSKIMRPEKPGEHRLSMLLAVSRLWMWAWLSAANLARAATRLNPFRSSASRLG